MSLFTCLYAIKTNWYLGKYLGTTAYYKKSGKVYNVVYGEIDDSIIILLCSFNVYYTYLYINFRNSVLHCCLS